MKPTNRYYENLSMQKITEALLRLMKQYPFSDITILQITQEAQIARRTFYLYYDSKMDILTNYYAVLTREYEEGLAEYQKADSRTQIEYFFRFWYEHREYAELLERQNLFYILIGNFSSYLKNEHEFFPKHDEYLVSYFSGGLWAVLYTWTRNGYSRSPKEMTDIIMEFHKNL